jgi:hypothetical protein
MPRRASACVACVTMLAACERRACRRSAQRGGADAAVAPAPPPRRTRRACCIVLLLGEALACTDPVCSQSVWLVGGTALPAVVHDGLIGAADEQLRADAEEAVGRRPVQRCRPAGQGGHGRIGVTVGRRRTRAGQRRRQRRTRRCSGCPRRRARRAALRRSRDRHSPPHRSAPSFHSCARRRRCAPIDQRYPRTGTHSPYPTRVYAGGPGGSAPKKDFKTPEWPTKKGSGGSGRTRPTVRRIPHQAERNNGEREKAVVKPNGCSKNVRFATKGWEGNLSLKESHPGTLARSCKSACQRRAWNEVRAGNQTWRG